MSAYPGMSSSMNLVRCVDPAMLAGKNVKKNQSTNPIPDMPTVIETHLETIMGGTPYASPNVKFTWTEYPDAVMDGYIGEDAGGLAVELLVGHAPDRLLVKFLNPTRNLHQIMSEFDIASMMEGIDVSGDVDGATYEMMSGTNDGYHPETTITQAASTGKVFAIPFAPANTSGEYAGPGGGGGGAPESSSGSDGRDGGQRGLDGPVGGAEEDIASSGSCWTSRARACPSS